MSAEFDRLKQAMLAIARSAFPHIDYLAVYPARVIKQSADGHSVDIEPLSDKLPAMERVPLRRPVPDCKILVDPGAFVFLYYEGGDPSQPACESWTSGQVDTLEFGSRHTIIRGDLSVQLGNANAAQPVVLGTQNALLEDDYDVEVIAACAALSGAIVTASGLPGWPTPAQLAALFTGAVTTFAAALQAAAVNRTAGRAATLSTLVKTA